MLVWFWETHFHNGKLNVIIWTRVNLSQFGGFPAETLRRASAVQSKERKSAVCLQ